MGTWYQMGTLLESSVKICSEDQLGNLFTKGLNQIIFPDCKRSLWVGGIHNLF
jgi:hypothetical protein